MKVLRVELVALDERSDAVEQIREHGFRLAPAHVLATEHGGAVAGPGLGAELPDQAENAAGAYCARPHVVDVQTGVELLEVSPDLVFVFLDQFEEPLDSPTALP